MRTEQKHGAPPEYPYTIKTIIKEMGLPNNRRIRDRLTRAVDKITTITPFTDPLTQYFSLSEKDFRLTIEILKGKPVKGTKADPKSRHPHQAEKLPMLTQKKEIKLPNGRIIKVIRNSTIGKVIEEVLLAQQNSIPYPEKAIADKVNTSVYDDRHSSKHLVNRINDILIKNQCKLTSYEIKIDGETVRAFKIEIIEEQSTPTSSPDKGFLKS